MNFHPASPEHPEFTAARVSAGIGRWNTWETPAAWRFIFWASLVAAELFGLRQVFYGIDGDLPEFVVTGLLTCVLAPPILRILLESQLLVFACLLRLARSLEAIAKRTAAARSEFDAINRATSGGEG